MPALVAVVHAIISDKVTLTAAAIDADDGDDNDDKGDDDDDDDDIDDEDDNGQGDPAYHCMLRSLHSVFPLCACMMLEGDMKTAVRSFPQQVLLALVLTDSGSKLFKHACL